MYDVILLIHSAMDANFTVRIHMADDVKPESAEYYEYIEDWITDNLKDVEDYEVLSVAVGAEAMADFQKITKEEIKTLRVKLNDEEKKIITIHFIPQEVDADHKMIAEVFTNYEGNGLVEYQFGLPCNPGDEKEIYGMVIGNLASGNLFWADRD
jgi:protein subunit release factor A